MLTDLLEPVRAYLSRKRLERMHCEAAAKLLEASGPSYVPPEDDAADWQLLSTDTKDADASDLDALRSKARLLADTNPYARNILAMFRNYVVGTGMKHEVTDAATGRRGDAATIEAASPRVSASARLRVAALWHDFLAANDWHTGNRKDWEFCLRTWRDGECFLRLFRQDAWPPRIHFIDPEHVAPDPRTGLPSHGIETVPGNVEVPVAYWLLAPEEPLPHPLPEAGRGEGPSCSPFPLREGGRGVRSESVPADRILHTKIGVDANVKRGVTLFRPVLDALRRFQGWLDVELIHRKLAASIVLVRKHTQNYPDGVKSFADSTATSTDFSGELGSSARRRSKILPGTIIDAQGFDLQYLAPNTHFDDAAILGRTILLSIAAGVGLPEFMVTSDASNANYASTLAAEGPAVRSFAAWQAFFIGQWQKLFRMVMTEAVRLGLLAAIEARHVTLHLTPPTLAVRNRHAEAQADALYFDRGALSARELSRRDGADAEQMRRERGEEDRETRRQGDKEHADV